MSYLIVVLLLALIPAKIANDKGYDFLPWYLYGVLLFVVALIHSILLEDKSEDDSNDENDDTNADNKKEDNYLLANNKISAKKLFDLMSLYKDGILTKDELIKEKELLVDNINKELEDINDLKKIKELYDLNIITEEEYNQFKNETIHKESLHLVNTTISNDNQNEAIKNGEYIYKVKLPDRYMPLTIKASKNATYDEIEQIVKEEEGECDITYIKNYLDEELKK